MRDNLSIHQKWVGSLPDRRSLSAPPQSAEGVAIVEGSEEGGARRMQGVLVGGRAEGRV